MFCERDGEGSLVDLMHEECFTQDARKSVLPRRSSERLGEIIFMDEVHEKTFLHRRQRQQRRTELAQVLGAWGESDGGVEKIHACVPGEWFCCCKRQSDRRGELADGTHAQNAKCRRIL